MPLGACKTVVAPGKPAKRLLNERFSWMMMMTWSIVPGETVGVAVGTGVGEVVGSGLGVGAGVGEPVGSGVGDALGLAVGGSPGLPEQVEAVSSKAAARMRNLTSDYRPFHFQLLILPLVAPPENDIEIWMFGIAKVFVTNWPGGIV